MLRASGAVEKAWVDARRFGELAKQAIAPLPPTEAKMHMLRLIDFVLTRDA
jgi:geranylgeranyl pyrophosphate synthase